MGRSAVATLQVSDSVAGYKDAPCATPSLRRGARARRVAGFTLIEMMIVVIIVAVLAAYAYSAYSKYVTRTNRAAATACLSEAANYMERYYTTSLSYTGATPSSALDCEGTSSTGLNYTYEFPSAASTTAYTYEAVPKGTQATNDTDCGTLSITNQGTRGFSGTSGVGTVAECWGH
ncbi:type IV pilin protein [Dyella mobilis]|uniref:Type IV pilin protein n=2 Tax=Dyella mobilis TaxID=1849582 RepID=A0ABS2KNM2_9GAMM|nr:type IV pilin protein [Dyella mobilis]